MAARTSDKPPPSAARVRFGAGGAWLTLAVSTLLCLGVLELLLRWLAPLYSSPYQPDDKLLVTLVPGAKKIFSRGAADASGRVLWQVNSAGFRGAELERPHGQARIVVYGDSNVAAEFSELPATYPAQLQRQLAPRQVESINAGVVGYGPDQVAVRLADDLEKLEPALVVVVIFADNDFGDLLRNRIYGLDDASGLVLNRYRLPQALRGELEQAAHPRGLRRLQVRRYAARLWSLIRARADDAPSIESYISTYVERSRERTAEAYARFLAEDPADRVADHPFHDYYDADIAMQPELPSARLKIALMNGVMRRLRDVAAQSATPLALVVLPSAIDVCEHYDMRVDAARYPRYDRARLANAVAAAAAAAGVPHLNLFAPLRARGACDLYFHGGDGHWNDAGQAFAARLTAELIIEAKLLPAVP